MLPSLQNETNGSCADLPVIGTKNKSSRCNRLDVDRLQGTVSLSLYSSQCTNNNAMRQQQVPLDNVNVVLQQSVTDLLAASIKEQWNKKQQSLHDILCRAEQIMVEDFPLDVDVYLSEVYAEMEELAELEAASATAAEPPSLTRFESYDSIKFYRRRRCAAKKGDDMIAKEEQDQK